MTQGQHPTITGFLERADVVFGPQYSAVLHGSAVRGDYLPGRSDLNLLVVAEGVGPDQLRGLTSGLALFES
ncbi:MAG TPA: nucleotidyltransferase domain-containing protein, partial [Gemmatimonadales bacterium]